MDDKRDARGAMGLSRLKCPSKSAVQTASNVSPLRFARVG
jgi:hypothetical protein